VALQQFDQVHNSAFYSEALAAARLPSGSTPSSLPFIGHNDPNLRQKSIGPLPLSGR
jgi:hypothetical protein